MSLGLIKPGASAALRHPKTGVLIKPLGFLKSGKAVWPVLGAGSDDPDDPEFTRGVDDDVEDDDEAEDEDEEENTKKRPVKKSSKSKKDDEDDDEDDEDEDDSRAHRASQQAKRYRLKLRQKERELEEFKTAQANKDKKPDEIVTQELSEARTSVTKLTEQNRTLNAQLAFFSVPTGIDWVDPADAFALAEREGLLEDVIDEDGNVDKRELRRGLRDLARRKKHLVKVQEDPKARGRKTTDDDEDEDEEDDEEEPRSRRSASTMNGGRKGKRQAGPSKSQLAAKFPVLNRL